MKKISLYLDTSVLNFYSAEDSPDEMKATKELLAEVKMVNMKHSSQRLCLKKYRRLRRQRKENC